MLDLLIPLIMRAKPALLGEFDEFVSFVDISENVITSVGTAGENLYAGGGTGWYMDVSQITQNLVRLARNTNIVLRTTQTRL